MDPNANTVQRIRHYVESEEYAKAEALAKLCDYLEECFSWEITFDGPLDL